MKNKLFNATKRNIVITSTVIVLLSMMIFSVGVIFFYRINLYKDSDMELNKQLSIILTNINIMQNMQQFPETNETQGGRFLLSVTMYINPRIILLKTRDDLILEQSANRYFDNETKLNISDKSEDKIVGFAMNGYNFRCRSLIINDFRYVLLINTDPEEESMRRLLNIVFFSLLALILFSYFLSKLLAAKVLKPVIKSYDEQVQFVQNASHEMRTPLAVIKGKLELLAIHPKGSIEDHFELISSLMSEVHGLERLNKDLLALSKEDVDTDIVKTNFSLNEMVIEFLEFFGTLAESQNKYFSAEIKEEIILYQDYHRFRQALILLIENAFKYTEEGDTVSLRIDKDDKLIYVRVQDTGIGIKEEEKDHIFDRFFRSDEVRGKNIDGNGIGLSILKSLSVTLGFKIGLNSVYGEGTEFTLTFKYK